MEKYYTPELNEFYIGFEYQIYVENNGWVDDKIDYDDFISSRMGGTTFEDYIIEYNYDGDFPENYSVYGNIRIKCLDVDDIKSLGWKRGGPWWRLKEWAMMYSDHLIDNGLIITKDSNLSEKGFTHYFRGVIKNKSELKKLMSQLEIK